METLFDDERRELFWEIGSSACGGSDGREAFRVSFAGGGGGGALGVAGFMMGSGFDSMLEKDIGSADRVGFYESQG